ncbi:hypothetical protein [Bacillus wiedmannii]|uniref:hypothetical protein n=1 Tax=Bacillus wiedmannii TaxID=1890302 RepID=UPI000BF86884|nr:hypothetical protein [Bacillus wiedmannii]PGD91920.1 hypothetical protein COM48_22615 [Bacillus wiedmannii]
MQKEKKFKLKRKKVVRNPKKFNLEFEKTRLSIEIPAATKENFKEAVEKHGKTMKEVLETYMRNYTIKVLQKEHREAQQLKKKKKWLA